MSTRTPRLNKQVQEVIDWEDKYKNLNEDQYVLKKALKEKDEIILKLSTKSRKLESEVSKLELMTTGEVQHKPIKRDREEDNLINTLYDQISKLKNQNSSLTEKNKSLVDQLERKKRELTLAKKISSNYKRPLTAPTKEITATEIEIRPGPTNFHHNTNSNNHIDQNLNTNILTSTNAITPDPNLLNIAKNYKARIAVLEEQLENFKDENARLSQKQRSDNQLPNINGDLESKLRDTKWRLQQLQTQYDFMASKTAAQSQTFKHMESQLEDYTLKISDLRNALKDLQREKEIRASTFIVIDFFDYETQTTTLQTSSKPSFDFAMTYKLLIDDFLIRYLASDVVTVEVNMAIGGDFTLLSRSAIPLNGLLRASPVIQLVNHPLLSIENGELIGHVNLDLRLALPISELYRLFLERHPLEKKFIDDIASRRVIESMTALEHAQSIESIKQKSNYGVDPQEESRLYNELEVTFIGGKNLKVNNNQPPSSYLYFQLLAFPDKFTNPIPHTSEPKYNEIFTFPMITNDYQIRLLRTSRMSVSVIDMNIEGQNKSNDDGLLGEVSVPLVDLSEGLSIHSTYKIKNSQEITGELEVNIKWKYPFRNQRELGPRALSNNDTA
eukprot:gene17157-22671_t